MITKIAPYITILTAIIAAYFTYRNQLRLKTFELLIERRKSVLIDIEKFISKLYEAKESLEIDNNFNTNSASKKYLREYFHEGLILMHKINGANFGSSVDILVDTFWEIITSIQKDQKPISTEDLTDWINRTTNTVSLIYGLAHRQLTKELEEMTLPWISRKIKARKTKNSRKQKR